MKHAKSCRQKAETSHSEPPHSQADSSRKISNQLILWHEISNLQRTRVCPQNGSSQVKQRRTDLLQLRKKCSAILPTSAQDAAYQITFQAWFLPHEKRPTSINYAPAARVRIALKVHQQMKRMKIKTTIKMIQWLQSQYIKGKVKKSYNKILGHSTMGLH